MLAGLWDSDLVAVSVNGDRLFSLLRVELSGVCLIFLLAIECALRVLETAGRCFVVLIVEEVRPLCSEPSSSWIVSNPLASSPSLLSEESPCDVDLVPARLPDFWDGGGG